MSVNKLQSVIETGQKYDNTLFIGTVVDNKDPEGQKRFKVQVPGLYEDGDLPWVGVQQNSPFGNGPTFGSFGSPAVGAIAIIELQGGSAAHPICRGYLNIGTNVPPEFHSESVWGFVDPAGNKLVVDMGGTLQFTHQSGIRLTFSQDGRATLEADTIHAQAATTATIEAPDVYVSGKAHFDDDVEVDGDVLIKKNLKVDGSIIDGTGTNTATHIHYDDPYTGGPVPGS